MVREDLSHIEICALSPFLVRFGLSPSREAWRASFESKAAASYTIVAGVLSAFIHPPPVPRHTSLCHATCIMYDGRKGFVIKAPSCTHHHLLSHSLLIPLSFFIRIGDQSLVRAFSSFFPEKKKFPGLEASPQSCAELRSDSPDLRARS